MRIWMMICISLALAALLGLALGYIQRKRYEKAIVEYQNKLLSQEMEEVRGIYKTMRGWRHDYHNHMQSIKAQLAMDDLEQARNYLNELETDLDDIRLLFDTGNIQVDAILNAKISLALEKGIPCDYKAVLPQKMTVSDIDFCVLIGNLIDNGVEACRSLPPEQQFLRLYIGPLKQQLYISVSNATGETVRKLDAEYISTKRGDHGHGLLRINRVVEKYRGYINRKNEPGVFVTEVLLPL